MTNNQKLKAKVVDEIADKLSRAKCVAFVDYKGLTVAETYNLRQDMRKEGVEFKVYKNRLVKIALQKAKIDFNYPLENTLALAISYTDEVAPARILKAAADKLKKTELKYGILDGKAMGTEEVKALASIPSKEVLISKLLYCIKSPLTKLALACSEIAKKQA